MTKKSRVKKITALMAMGLLVFTNISCAQQQEAPASVKTGQVVEDKPVMEKAESQSEVVYLKAENAAAFLGKGSHVNLVGRLRNNNYEKDGETIYKFDTPSAGGAIAPVRTPPPPP